MAHIFSSKARHHDNGNPSKIDKDWRRWGDAHPWSKNGTQLQYIYLLTRKAAGAGRERDSGLSVLHCWSVILRFLVCLFYHVFILIRSCLLFWRKTLILGAEWPGQDVEEKSQSWKHWLGPGLWSLGSRKERLLPSTTRCNTRFGGENKRLSEQKFLLRIKTRH